MKRILILGPGCAKCKATYANVMEALKQTGVEAEVIKIEDMAEIMKYDVLQTPVLMIDGKAEVKGRVAEISEIRQLLLS